MQYINKRKVAILLPTYNGEKYIRELLDSLLVQTYQDITIYIRDDISKDGTPAILKEYEKTYNNICLLPSEQNLGPKKSFFLLMDQVISDYYMFCDQDDVWMSDKVEKTYKKMQEAEMLNPSKPVIIHTDLRIVDGNLKTIAPSLWQYRGYNVDLPHTFEYLCHYNDITGCTMMINSAVKQACPSCIQKEVPDFVYHDYLIALLSVKVGGVIVPLKEATIIYRRHGDNETDALKFGSSIFSRLGDVFKYISEQKKRHTFFRELGYGNFLKYLIYKLKLLYLRKQYAS